MADLDCKEGWEMGWPNAQYNEENGFGENLGVSLFQALHKYV